MSRRSEQVGFFAALNAAGADYVMVGGVAVNAHGFVRNTRSLDIFFRPTMENAQAVFRALEKLGAPLAGVSASDLLDDEEHYQVETEHGSVDLLSSIGEMGFDRVWQNRIDVEVDGVLVQLISKRDLIVNKRQVGRSIDLLDAEELELVKDDVDPQMPE